MFKIKNASGDMIPNVSKQELLTFWRSVIDPKGIGMADAIAGDIAAYTGESVSIVLSKMATGKTDLKTLWEQSKPNVSDTPSVEDFYYNQFVEAYELANWHCGREDGHPPLSYAYAAKFAQENHLNRVLDFGSGIGTGCLCLASVGCQVYAADIAKKLLPFVEYRVRARGYEIELINLKESQPLKHFYDLIVCYDVLEHVPDQLSKLRELSSYLRFGGYLIVNLMQDSEFPDQPMHISSAGDVVALIRKTNLVPIWSDPPIDVQVLQRSRYGRLWNYAASWKDCFQRK
jgi:SAM-dependent methyltransferase